MFLKIVEKCNHGKDRQQKKKYPSWSCTQTIEYLKGLKILGKVVNLITRDTENLWVELAAGGLTLPEIKMQRGVFQEDSLLPLIFIIEMKLLNHIKRKCTNSYEFKESRDTINHLMYFDGIRIFSKNEKKKQTRNTSTHY